MMNQSASIRSPRPSVLIATEDTLFKVYDSLIKAGLNDRAAMNALHDMQNRGIYFRELAE